MSSRLVGVRRVTPCRSTHATADFWTGIGNPPSALIIGLEREVVLAPAQHEQEELIHGEELDGEGEIAQIAGDGHLEQVWPRINERHGIVPLWQRGEVPHLPE